MKSNNKSSKYLLRKPNIRYLMHFKHLREAVYSSPLAKIKDHSLDCQKFLPVLQVLLTLKKTLNRSMALKNGRKLLFMKVRSLYWSRQLTPRTSRSSRRTISRRAQTPSWACWKSRALKISLITYSDRSTSEITAPPPFFRKLTKVRTLKQRKKILPWTTDSRNRGTMTVSTPRRRHWSPSKMKREISR